MILSIFQVPLDYLYVLFGEMSTEIFYPFFNWAVYLLVLSCMSCLYILEINLSKVAPFQVFSPISFCLLFVYDQQTFYVKSKVISILSFSGHIVSGVITQLHYWATKAFTRET